MPTGTVVIVGDDLDFVGMLRERVRQVGCRPIWVRDAREAIAAITHERPAIVVVDASVPRARAQELSAKLDRSLALARIPRLVLSASNQGMEARLERFRAVDVVCIAERVRDDPRAAEQVVAAIEIVARDPEPRWERESGLEALDS